MQKHFLVVERAIVTGLLSMFFLAHAHAALEQIQVGGQIVLYSDWNHNSLTPGTGLRYPPSRIFGRPAGAGIGNDDGIVSWAGWSQSGTDVFQVTQWTRLHVRCTFSKDYAAFVEFDHQESWGESLRSNYLTGADTRSASENQAEIYQAFLEFSNGLNLPLRIRVGRQELSLGSEWLLGTNTLASAPTFGLSFDAIRATCTLENASLDVFASKLSEAGGSGRSRDIDFHGMYGSYYGWEPHSLDLYWFWLRDDTPLEDAALNMAAEWVQRIHGVDQYSTTHLHTLGFRATGLFASLDYEVEAAWQFGKAGQVGAMFRPVFYGDDEARFRAWALDTELGYTLNMAWTPRLKAGYARLGGEDRRDISAGQYIAAWVYPFYTAPASVSFNRLFSNRTYSYVLDVGDLSNVQIGRVGVTLTPTEKIEISGTLSYLRALAAFARPTVPVFSFLTRKNDKELGWETNLEITYDYTEDFYLCLGWSHLFTREGLRRGHFNNNMGLQFNGGIDDRDADYIYCEMGSSF